MEISLPGDPSVWVPFGLEHPVRAGGVLLRAEGMPLEIRVRGLRAAVPDGLPLVAAGHDDRRGPDPGAASGPAGPLGIVALDHLVALTGDLDRTGAALEAAGVPLRRRAGRLAFHHLGNCILELAAADGPPRIWGITFAVGDLDAAAARLGAALGPAKDAVQPGRRIATVRAAAGLPLAVALMSPRLTARAR